MNMRKNTFGVKKLSALVVPLALAVVLAACGGTGSPANRNDGSITLGAAHGANLAEWLSWLYDNAEDYTTYILPVPAGNSLLEHQWEELPQRNGITIDIRPVAPANIIQRGTGALFVVPSGVTLRLSQNIILDGDDIGTWAFLCLTAEPL